MSAVVSNARVDLVLNLLRRSLDPIADLGEAKNAADKMVVIARRDGIDFPALTKSLVPTVAPKPRPAPVPDVPAECETIMPFGQHVGYTLLEIARDDINYLAWMALKMETYPDLQEAARVTLRFVRNRERRPR